MRGVAGAGTAVSPLVRDVVRLQRQVGNQVVQRLIGADAGRGFGAAQTGLLIQRQWNFSQANSKAEFVRRTDEDNSLFLELVQLTKRTAGPYAVIDVDAVAHSAYATLGRAMRDAFPGRRRP